MRATEVIDPVVSPVMAAGEQRGCELSFHLAQRNSSGDIASAVGASIIFAAPDEQHWAVALKIGYQPKSAVVLPPAEAFFITKSGSNQKEIVKRYPADDFGYAKFLFSGAKTLEVLNELNSDGRMKLRFRLNSGEEQTWNFDLGSRDDVRTSWRRCVAGLQAIAQSPST